MAERTLHDWLQYLEALHPRKIDLGLDRVAEVARRLQLIPFPAQVLTVAGTNGKGSVVYCCDAVLRASGKRCGRYTSPHLFSYNERIVVDGVLASDRTILAAFRAIEEARREISLSYFEFATLAALWVFAREGVDIAILEVGLGGRLDAVNIIDSDVAVVTQIDLDHQQWLGDSVAEIAPEKAAIARANRPVVLAEADYPRSLFKTLESIAADVRLAQRDWIWRVSDERNSLRITLAEPELDLTLPLVPGLRPANVAAAVYASSLLVDDPSDLPTSVAALQNLEVPARRQRLPLAGRELVLDVAHNPAAMQGLALELLRHPAAGKSLAVLGLMADKDLPAMTRALSSVVDGAFSLAIPGIDRAQKPERIWEALDNAGIAIAQAEFSASAVLEQIWARTDAGDRVIVCGSFYSVATMVEELLREKHLRLEADERLVSTAVPVASPCKNERYAPRSEEAL